MVLLVLECSICVYVIRFVMCVLGLLYTLTCLIGPVERWGAGVEYHFQEFNEPYAPS